VIADYLQDFALIGTLFALAIVIWHALGMSRELAELRSLIEEERGQVVTFYRERSRRP